MNELTVHNQMPVAEMYDMAEQVAKSGLLPGIKTAAAAFVVSQHVTTKGMTFIEFLSRYHVTGQGTVSVKADVQLADMMKAGFKVKWLRFDDIEARANFIDIDGHAVELAYTIEDARKAELLDGKNDNWRKRPDTMLRARLISKAKRMLCPGDTAGLYNESETDEIEVARAAYGEPVKATPEKVAKAAKAVKEAVKILPPAAEPEDAEVVVDVKEAAPAAAPAAAPTPAVTPAVIPDPWKTHVKPVIKPDAPDATVCPIKNEMFGKPWADMPADVLDYALELDDTAMTPAHFDAIRAAIAAKGGAL